MTEALSPRPDAHVRSFGRRRPSYEYEAEAVGLEPTSG